ncbi:hypothetical protein ANCCAN_12851 [Ancylostoma caninum]|uniref:Uncharacterized protein n=1 Tax=Ancylostoma caninum TaxID=29170 RepID=A0A368G9Y0_ANCCA|nr:hypothetical protein ANCCAN_12851 [Ancylostoma caninum]
MVKHSASNKKTNNADFLQEMPLWCVITRLSAIESRLLSNVSSPSAQQNLIYPTLVKVRAEKLRRITWIGIDEQEDEDSARRFDYKILKEAVY